MGKKHLHPISAIEDTIHIIRGQRVILSPNLATLYGVELRALTQAVRRNARRFPSDFMFQLKDSEFEILKSQFVTSSWGGSRRSTPLAFTEQGVAMLSSVLRSQKAIDVNIEIMRAFVRMRHLLESNKELAGKIDELEKKYDGQFVEVFRALRQLMSPPAKDPRKIGF